MFFWNFNYQNTYQNSQNFILKGASVNHPNSRKKTIWSCFSLSWSAKRHPLKICYLPSLHCLLAFSINEQNLKNEQNIWQTLLVGIFRGNKIFYQQKALFWKCSWVVTTFLPVRAHIENVNFRVRIFWVMAPFFAVSSVLKLIQVLCCGLLI